MLTTSTYPEYNQLDLFQWSAPVFISYHCFKPSDKLIVTTNDVAMFMSVLNFMMNYKLRMLPVNINIDSFKFEITETPALSSETVPPRVNVGKSGEQALA